MPLNTQTSSCRQHDSSYATANLINQDRNGRRHAEGVCPLHDRMHNRAILATDEFRDGKGLLVPIREPSEQASDDLQTIHSATTQMVIGLKGQISQTQECDQLKRGRVLAKANMFMTTVGMEKVDLKRLEVVALVLNIG